ncbi:hypothetical protein SEUBUCD646_0N01330 [Saccharomyces eubayanus]|uniref:Uncharacterized protein n=1 Tax=Saccharomyces pastorianus TaxID=27292 RepID=A0A6C1EE05_SACPS|nr:hypothetical protein GRS66_010276 [Saccharomyces pastorianus]CAI1705710.1 hypothetical protein SEUBUCD646_0N01330 [Saccharomyces eubayanus]
MLGLGQSAQAYSANDDTEMQQTEEKMAGVPGCGQAHDLEYPHHDNHSSPHHQHSGILPSECSGPTLNTGAGAVGIPGCGRVTNKVVSDRDNNARSTLASFDTSNMTEARMNSKNLPVGCQNTSMPHFDGSMDQRIPGAGSPRSEPHHIDAWSNIPTFGAGTNDQNIMHPQAAPLDSYNEHMVRDETSDNSASLYTVHTRGSPADIPSATQRTEGRKNYLYGMNDQHSVPRNYATDKADPSSVETSADPDISNVQSEILRN